MQHLLIGLLLAAGVPAQQPAQSAPQALAQPGCTGTLGCYGQCNPMSEACLSACDGRGSPASAQGARAVLQCMAQSGCQDQKCVAQRCGRELAACTSGALVAQPAPRQPASEGGYDLVYRLPQGWNESRTYLNAITLGFDQEDFYNHLHPRIHVFPSRARQGTVNDQYRALWNEIVVAPGEFSSTVPAGPLRRRTHSGYAMAMDVKNTTLAKGNGYVSVGLYVIHTDEKLVPILTTNLDWHYKEVAEAFFDNLTVRGAPASKTPLFDTSELAGHWSTQAVSVATYVNASGGYAGDASIATADGLFLDADGTFRSHFVGVGRGMAVQEDDQGRWKVEDDMLVLAGKRTDKRRIWGHGTAPQGNPDSICMVPYGAAQPQYFSPEDGINSSWYGRAK